MGDSVHDAWMTSAEEILNGTDWLALEHAHDVAGDLPELLRGLLSGDPDVAGDVLGVLDVSIETQVG